MSTITKAPPAPSLAPLASPDVYRMTVDEYERMAEVGILDDDRVELIDGYLVRKMPKKPPHVWAVAATLRALGAILSGWCCRKEDPVRIPKFDEPEPDVAVVRGSIEDYRARTPGPKDVALLVEVSERTLARDRGEKRAAYARGRIPVYWIINLIDRQVEVYSRPSARGYRSSRVYKPGEDIPVVIAGSEAGRIAVADILP
jgi:Uma2 family endonuclease